MSTADALRKLTNREVFQVCLIHAGRLSAVVTYDDWRQELVFRFLDSAPRLSVRALLFQTEPGWMI